MRKSAATLFRQRLREIRKARQLTQEQAAELIGIPHKIYQFYELGVKGNPTLATVDKFCNGFGLTFEEFFTGNPTRK